MRLLAMCAASALLVGLGAAACNGGGGGGGSGGGTSTATGTDTTTTSSDTGTGTGTSTSTTTDTTSTTTSTSSSTTTTTTGCPTFTACGGDVTGTWTYTLACMELGSNPLAGACPSATASAAIDVTGTADFKADKTYTVNGTQKVTITVDAPKSCFGGGCPPAGTGFTWTDAGTSCKGTMTQGPEPVAQAGTYTTATNTLTINQTSPSANTMSGDYCVNGTSMDVLMTDADGNKLRYTVTKQ